MKASAQIIRISEPTEGGNSAIQSELPYSVSLTIEGTCDLLFHRYNVEAVEAKQRARKNSAAKKTDDIESYVYRDDGGILCLPGEYLRSSIIDAAKYRQDPRSPRKSARDRYKAALVSLTPLVGLGCKEWDYLDKRRVIVQRNAIPRIRPALRAPWRAT